MLNIIKQKLEEGNMILPIDIINALENNFEDSIKYFIKESMYVEWNTMSENDMRRLVNILKDSEYVKNATLNNFVASCPPLYYLAKKFSTDNKAFSLTMDPFGVDTRLKWSSVLYDYYDTNQQNQIKFMNIDNRKEALDFILDNNLNDREYFSYFRMANKDISMEEMFRKLVNKDFVISLENSFLSGGDYNPVFLLASLKNDRDTTLNIVNNNRKAQSFIFGLDYQDYISFKNLADENKIDLADLPPLSSPYTQYYNIQKGYIILDENDLLSIFKRNPNNKFNMYKCLNDVEDPNILNDYRNKLLNIAKHMPDSNLGKESEIRMILSNTRNMLPMTLWGFKDQSVAKQFYKEKKITKDELNTIEHMLALNDMYTKHEEARILKRLRYSPVPKNVEEAIKMMDAMNKTRFELSFDELYFMQIYANKLLKRAGLNKTKMDMFSYSENPNYLGVCINGGEIINICNGHNLSIKNMVHTINHEINHAIQHKNLQEKNLQEDPEILDYEKDAILRFVLGDKYHKQTYFKTSSEYDADYKASIQTKLLFENIDNLYEQSLLDYDKLIEYKDRDYTYDKTRGTEGKSLNEFFVETMDGLARQVPNNCYLALIKDLKKNDNILCYEYEISKQGIRERSLQELERLSNKKRKAAKIYKDILDVKSIYAQVNSNKNDSSILEEEKKLMLANKMMAEKTEHTFKNEMKDLKQRLSEKIEEVENVTKEEKENGKRKV